MMSSPVIVHHADLKHPTLNYCNPTSRVFFARHGLDWRRFVLEGLPAEDIEATGDAMAIALAAVARARVAAESQDQEQQEP